MEERVDGDDLVAVKALRDVVVMLAQPPREEDECRGEEGGGPKDAYFRRHARGVRTDGWARRRGLLDAVHSKFTEAVRGQACALNAVASCVDALAPEVDAADCLLAALPQSDHCRLTAARFSHLSKPTTDPRLARRFVATELD